MVQQRASLIWCEVSEELFQLWSMMKLGGHGFFLHISWGQVSSPQFCRCCVGWLWGGGGYSTHHRNLRFVTSESSHQQMCVVPGLLGGLYMDNGIECCSMISKQHFHMSDCRNPLQVDTALSVDMFAKKHLARVQGDRKTGVWFKAPMMVKVSVIGREQTSCTVEPGHISQSPAFSQLNGEMYNPIMFFH